jgi:hypothetical protein
VFVVAESNKNTGLEESSNIKYKYRELLSAAAVLCHSNSAQRGTLSPSLQRRRLFK